MVKKVLPTKVTQLYFFFFCYYYYYQKAFIYSNINTATTVTNSYSEACIKTWIDKRCLDHSTLYPASCKCSGRLRVCNQYSTDAEQRCGLTA